MKKFKPLNSNSTIGIICPSFCEDVEVINKKIDMFKILGFNIKKGQTLYNSYGYLAGSDIDRANDLNAMFNDSSVNAIVCFRGGFGSIRMAKFLDLKIIKNNPKPFCGYSDITLLLNYISNKCKFPTFHSPMVNSDFSDPTTKEYFLKLLSSSDNNIIYNLKKLCGENFRIWNKNNFNGTLVGGNLSTICSSIGTPFEIDFKNKIVFLEDVDESAYAVDRMLSQLILCGKLSKASAIILGFFTECSSKNANISVNDIIKEKLVSLQIPIINGFPAGHDYPNVTLPIGCHMTFNCLNNLLSISHKLYI